MIFKNIFITAFSIVSLNAYAAEPGQSFTLDCPSKSEIIKKFSEVKGRPFPVTQLENLDFEDFRVWTTWQHTDSPIAEKVMSEFTSTPVDKYKEHLKLTFDNSPVLVAVLNSQKYPYAYISCRYKIQDADPGYLCSSSFTELVNAGLTRIDDGYINFETMIRDTDCEHVAGTTRIICAEKSKNILKNPQIMKNDAAGRMEMTFIK